MNIIRNSTHPRSTRRLFGSTGLGGFTCLALLGLAASLPVASAADAQSLPTGGTVVAGQASIATGANAVTVTQSSQSAVINWQGFSIGKDNSVTFVQPNSSAVALNRVTGADPSVILGNLTANGKVFLVNANGILFGKSANVNVGGLVASTLNLTDADFMAGRNSFTGSGGTVLNQGSITAADGGFVALLGANVSNLGVIRANLGTIALAAGEAITLDVAGDGLLNVAIDKGAVNALVNNGGMLGASGGKVLLTAQAAGKLLHTVVNNTGVIEARTLQNRNGVILLLGDMQTGTMNVAGVLDASAPDGGNGGFIETSAASVSIGSGAAITTEAPAGVTGTWLIDPQDFTIGAGGNISGATLSAMLVTNSVIITTSTGPDATVPGAPPVTTLNTASPGNGDINVNDAIAWTAAPNTTTLSLFAVRDVNVNNAITATNGNVVICCGRDANINAAVTTTNGSILVTAGHNISLNSAGFNAVNPAIVGVFTVTDGNLTLCAGHDVLIAGAVTLTRGSTIPAQSLNLASGLTIITGNDGTGPGVGGGTLTFAPLTPPVTVTNAAVAINYNPVSYAAPSDYSTSFTLTEGAALTQRMLVFPTATKVADGTTNAVLTGFSGLPTGVTLVAGPDATAVFDSAEAGSNIGITYAGYTLAGPDASKYALAVPCCGQPTRTTGTITPVVPPVDVPPVDVPPVDVPPVDVPPVDVPPVDVPPVDVPPVDVPPVDVPPVDVPPIDVPPIDVPPVDIPPVIVPPVVAPPTSGTVYDQTEIPVVVPAPTGLNIAVLNGGVRMPAYQVASLQPVAAPAAPVVIAPVPVPAPKPVIPVPVYPRKQDRN